MPVPNDGTTSLPSDAGGRFFVAPWDAVNNMFRAWRSDPNGSGMVKDVRSQTGTPSSVAASATSGTLLIANANRLGATFYNDSPQVLYLLLGAGPASATVYTVQVGANGGYYEVPYNYTGIITGVWAASPTGAARITELT